MVQGVIDETAVPGTVHLIDLEGVLTGHLGNRDIVLVPRPSSDPEDPLNWTRVRKMINFTCVMMYLSPVAIVTNSLAVMSSPSVSRLLPSTLSSSLFRLIPVSRSTISMLGLATCSSYSDGDVYFGSP